MFFLWDEIARKVNRTLTSRTVFGMRCVLVVREMRGRGGI